MGGIQLLKMVWQSGPLFGLIILSIAYALPSPNDVVPENKLVSIDDATSSSPRASAEAVVASMLQTGADWTACSSLANTTRTEVTDEVERLQSMLDIEVDGCACAELGQDEVNRTNSLVTIANERVVTATRSLEVASNTQVQLTDQQFSLLQQEVCSWVHLDIGFTTVHATYEQAVIEKATAETEVTFTVRNYNEAVEEAARLKLECECQTRSAHDTAWAIANAETSRTERERAWAQAHHIDCVIAQTSEADCHIATAPDVSKPYMCPDVTSAACGGGEAACDGDEDTLMFDGASEHCASAVTPGGVEARWDYPTKASCREACVSQSICTHYMIGASERWGNARAEETWQPHRFQEFGATQAHHASDCLLYSECPAGVEYNGPSVETYKLAPCTRAAGSESPSGPPVRYVLVTSGTCEDRGMTKVMDPTECLTAAHAIGSTQTSVGGNYQSGNSIDRPAGCTMHRHVPTATLWNPTYGDLDCGSLSFDCICEVPPPTGAR